MGLTETEKLRLWIEALDPKHRLYAQGYADQLALAEPAPSAEGLDRGLVREIRRRIWQEWRRRLDAMPGKRAAR